MSKPLFPCYLLLGEDRGSKKQKIQSIRRALKRRGSLALQSYWVEECAVEQLLALVRNPPLFEEQALIIYHNVDQLKGSQPHLKLKGYLAKPTPQSTLILTSELNSLNYAWVRQIATAAKMVCWQPFQSAMVNEVRNIFQQQGLEIATPLIERFLSALESDSAIVRSSSEQLASYCHSVGAVNEKIIEDFFSFGHAENIFGLINECLRRKVQRALPILYSLLDAGVENSHILHMLYRSLHHLLALHSASGDFGGACRKRGIVWRSMQQRYREALNRFSAEELQLLLVCLSNTEAKLRQSGKFSRPLLGRLIVTLCEGAVSPLAPRWPPALSLAQAAANR